ncbi:MAG: hypothetical protein JJU09_00465 [Rhodobacteraceae bacterium]|nr:hypothetical protein [Paracoccaceae bacterium]
MAETIHQDEAAPADYPLAIAVGHDALWQRIEAYVAHRWTPRGVVWIVDGPGDWRVPLTPAEIDATEVWHNGAFQAVTLAASPLGGLHLPEFGPYRIGATVGADSDVPPAVMEAFNRFAAYMDAEDDGAPGASTVSLSEGSLSATIKRDPKWLARAIQLSGAADLLRPYRRA